MDLELEDEDLVRKDTVLTSVVARMLLILASYSAPLTSTVARCTSTSLLTTSLPAVGSGFCKVLAVSHVC